MSGARGDDLIPEGQLIRAAEHLRILGQPLRLRLVELLIAGRSTPQQLSPRRESKTNVTAGGHIWARPTAPRNALVASPSAVMRPVALATLTIAPRLPRIRRDPWASSTEVRLKRDVALLALSGGRPRRTEGFCESLEANLVEHRLQAKLDAPNLARFATITAHTVLMGGDKSPDAIGRPLLNELARVISDSTVVILPGLGHLAPQDNPDRIATALLA